MYTSVVGFVLAIYNTENAVCKRDKNKTSVVP